MSASGRNVYELFMLRETASVPKTRIPAGTKAVSSGFFGTAELPVIAIDEVAFEALATESTNKGYTVPGVQKKLSLHLFSEGNTPRLTLVNYPTGYILKPQVPEFEALPQAEQLVMCMADAAGIVTVPHALIMGKDGPAYITKRVDRIFTKKQNANAGDGGFLPARPAPDAG